MAITNCIKLNHFDQCLILSAETYCCNNNNNISLYHAKTQWKTSFEKNCFSAWASTLNMGLINKVDMVCLSPVGYGV